MRNQLYNEGSQELQDSKTHSFEHRSQHLNSHWEQAAQAYPLSMQLAALSRPRSFLGCIHPGTGTLLNLKTTYIFELSERHKLDNVPCSWLSCHRFQNTVVSIKELHCFKIGFTNTNNDDGHGQLRGINNCLPSLV